MGKVIIRAARPADAPFLAIAMQEADRGHTGIGSWDVLFPGADNERLPILAALAVASPRSYVHWLTFLVADFQGEPVATVAGYVPAMTPPELFAAACRAVLGDAAQARIAASRAWSRNYFAVELPGDTLRMEWVYTRPGVRGQGISVRLIARLLEDSKAQAIKTAHVGTYIGNEPAIATYHRAGFEAFAECRHLDYERRFKTPGLAFLRRDT
jgi:ribosomal protein S18 acetylase RimI-like enzyme